MKTLLFAAILLSLAVASPLLLALCAAAPAVVIPFLAVGVVYGVARLLV